MKLILKIVALVLCFTFGLGYTFKEIPFSVSAVTYKQEMPAPDKVATVKINKIAAVDRLTEKLKPYLKPGPGNIGGAGYKK